MGLIVLLFIVVGFVIGLPLCASLVRVGHRAGTLDSPGAPGHAKQLRSVPNIGGIAIFWAAVGPVMLGLLGLLVFSPERILPESLQPLQQHVLEEVPSWWGIVLSALLIHLTGLWDDRRTLGPVPKLLVQVVLAVVLASVLDIRMLHVLDQYGIAGQVLSIAMTVAWLVVITNAMNFLDNMDGLCAGIGTIAALILMVTTIINGQWFLGISLALLAGSLLGFLVKNFSPARIFMGDGGSLVIGWLLGIAAIRITYVDPSDPGYALGTAWYGVLMPLVVLAIPIYDLLSVVLIRIYLGRSPFVGDQRHFSHRLVQQGLSEPMAVVVIWLLAGITGIGGMFLGTLLPWQAMLLAGQVLLVLVLLALLEYAGWRTGTRR